MPSALVDLVPILILFALIVGSIYRGRATPTEAATVGVAGAPLIALAFGGVNWAMMRESLLGTTNVTSMITLIIIGASFLNFNLSSAVLGRELTAFLEGVGLSPLDFIMVVVLIYIVLGFFMETLR